jgi:hypothetical protein
MCYKLALNSHLFVSKYSKWHFLELELLKTKAYVAKTIISPPCLFNKANQDTSLDPQCMPRVLGAYDMAWLWW